MADRTFLDWPFFEPRHKALAADLDRWAQANLGHVDHGSVDDECRRIVDMLGRDGWLVHSAPDPEKVPTPSSM